MHNCFVIMPIGATSSTHKAGYWSDHFEKFVKPAVDLATDENNNPLGFTAKLSDPAGAGIIGDVFKNLTEADVVLAELTDFNPNVFYELGIRHTLRDRSIMIIEEGAPIPFYFQNYKIIKYNPTKKTEDFLKFKQDLQKQLRELKKSGENLFDNPVVDYFRGVGQKVVLAQREEATNLHFHFRKSGISTVFLPSTNRERNFRKEEVINNAHEYIKLLASTGHSYLAVGGHRFKNSMIKRMEVGTEVRIILLNPWTDSGLFLALGELPKADPTKLQMEALESMQSHRLRGIDPVELIRASDYYQDKLLDSLRGYERLKRSYKNKIELKITNYEIVATILLTEHAGFFEPYIHVNLQERFQQLMLTFEMEFSNSSYMHRHSLAYFDRLWTLSQSVSEYYENEKKYKADLKKKYS